MAVPVVTVESMRVWEDATWAGDVCEDEVIARVGVSLAHRIRCLTRERQRVLLLAGRGHNGDDVRAALPHLSDRLVTCFEVSDPGLDLEPLKSLLIPRPSLIVDGLFGIGLNRPLSREWIHLIETVNATGARVLSVDVPSGLNANTGDSFGSVIRATETWSVEAPKMGVFRGEGSDFAGRVTVSGAVGLAPWDSVSWRVLPEAWWSDVGDFRSYPPIRPAGSHKGDFGHLAIIAGSHGYHGAAVLAARGAGRARPGCVTVLTTNSSYPPVAAQLAFAMVREGTGPSQLPSRTDAILIGPGLAGPDVSLGWKDWLREAWNDLDAPIIVDASALDWLPEGPISSSNLRVITPHPGEAARLLKSTVHEIESDRFGAVRRLSQLLGGCWVVLKGRHTVLGCQHGRLLVNASGNPGLAQGGSGDVLAGYLSGLITQRGLSAEPERTLSFGVWEHGSTADGLEMERSNWTAEDLAEQIGSSRSLWAD